MPIHVNDRDRFWSDSLYGHARFDLLKAIFTGSRVQIVDRQL